VWRSLRQAPLLVDLLAELMNAIAPDRALALDVIMRQLLEQLCLHRCLLILDNVEAVLSISELVGTSQPGYENYGWLLEQLGEGRHQNGISLLQQKLVTEKLLKHFFIGRYCQKLYLSYSEPIKRPRSHSSFYCR
jgi:hypothetical protein